MSSTDDDLTLLAQSEISFNLNISFCENKEVEELYIQYRHDWLANVLKIVQAINLNVTKFVCVCVCV